MKISNLSWSDFKIQLSNRTRSLQTWSKGDNLVCWFSDGELQFEIELDKEGTDHTDYTNNYASLANKKASSQEISGLKDPKGMRARLVGTHSTTTTKNSMTSIDWTISQLTYAGVNKKSYFDGIEYFAKDAVIGDSMIFQVVDTDGSGVGLGLYPQAYYDAYKDGNGDLLVEQFGDSWYVVPDVDKNIVLYKARLYPGLKLRIKYTSTGTVTDPYIICNIFRHMDGNS